jgi:hypothetical protein
MIIVKLDGGLGNQMFQYAFGRSFSVNYKIPFKLDISSLFEYRKYELDIFGLNANFATKEDLLFFDRQKLSIKEKVMFKIKHGFFRTLYISEREGLDTFTFPEKLTKNILISGHWQSEYYFKSIEWVIRSDFSFPEIKSESNKFFRNQIQQTNSVSVHIRRGDYLLEQNNKVHGVLPVKYYRQAVDYVRKRISDPVFYIFSDDPNWVLENLDIKGEVYFVIGNENNHAYVDMQLMSFCKHNIIANSSFSWWGAWLNNYPSKIVIAPKQWFSDVERNKISDMIIPSGWIRL